MGNPTDKLQPANDSGSSKLIEVKSNFREKIEIEINQNESIVILPFETAKIKSEYKNFLNDFIEKKHIEILGAK